MNYTIKAIPTRYAGVEFRSRLEATWAAYFDLVGVSWDYEPFDLDGWTPDLLVRVSGFDLLAEIKPVRCDDPLAPEVFAKARKYRNDHWILCLGLGPELFTIGTLCDQPRAVDQSRTDAQETGLGLWLDVHEKLHPIRAKSIWKEAANLTRWKGKK